MSDGSVASSGRTALRVLAVVLLVVVVAPFVVTGMPAVIGAEESFVVLSGSMNAEPEPIIQPGDVVIVDGVNPANIEEQDIITFSTGADEPVTHRVVNVTEQDGQVAFRTKGDANEDADQQLIGPDQVVGEVILVLPLIGHVVNFANTTQGFVLLVLLPIGLLVLSEIWNLLMADDESTEEESEPDRSPPAAAAEPTVASEAEADDEDGPSTVSLGRTQMGWITVGFVPIAAAAGYLAFRLQTAWILTVFFASVGLTLLSGLLYLRIRWGGTATETGTGTTAEAARPADPEAGGAGRAGSEAAHARGAERATSTALTTVEPAVEDGFRRNPIVNGRIEGNIDTDSYVSVSVDSRDDLVEMAMEKGSWVVHDTDAGAYVFVDGGMLFRYDDGMGTNGPATNWEEESGWVTFSEGGDGTERTNGSSGPGRPDGAEGMSTTERATETDPEADEIGTEADVTGTESRRSSTSTDPMATGSATSVTGFEETERTGTEEVEAVGETSELTRNGDESTTAAEVEETEVVPAIRRVEDVDADSDADADADTASELDVDADEELGGDGSDEGDRAAPDGSVETDGGTETGRSGVVDALARVLRFPVWALAVVGYLVVEPPAALYRALQSDDDGGEEGSQSDTRTEGET